MNLARALVTRFQRDEGFLTAQFVVAVAFSLLILVLVANLIAWPVAWLLMNWWLEGFAYRIEIIQHVGLFLVAGLAALGVALLTVSYQAVKAARANPVDALRYE